MLKPGPGAGKVVYEIEHVAYTCVPRLTVADFPPLAVGKPTRLTLVVRNPVEREIKVRLTAVTSATGHSNKAAEESKEGGRGSGTQPAASVDVWSVLPAGGSCDVRLSDDWVWLPAYDEIAEESGILQEQKRPDDAPSDNPNVSSSHTLDTAALSLHSHSILSLTRCSVVCCSPPCVSMSSIDR